MERNSLVETGFARPETYQPAWAKGNEMYNGHRSMISNTRLQAQRDMLEETTGKARAAKALGFPADHPHLVEREMTARIRVALWQIDNWDWICEVEAQAADHADLTDTQDCARW